MHRLLVLYPAQDDPERFRDYYVNKHAPLARTLPGAKAMSWGFDVAELNGGGPWECVFTCDFEDAEAMGRAMQSPEGQATAADVGNFANPPPMLFHFPITTA